jgi:predicted transposase YbfD/YdcC
LLTLYYNTSLNWTRGYFWERVQPGSVIAIDGKTVRGSATGAQRSIYLVSAWSDELGLVLGQIKTKEKSNEITAIPQLLSVLDIFGCIIAIDAISCQKRIASDITRGKRNYVFSLKENHPEVHAEIKELFDEKSLGEPEYVETTKDHRCIEKRKAWLSKDISWFEGNED